MADVLRGRDIADCLHHMIYLLFGYIWLFVYRPFEIWPLLAEFRIERVYMLAILVYWAANGEKRLTKNRLNCGFAFMTLSIVACAVMSPYGALIGNRVVEEWFKVSVFYVVLMTSLKKEEDLRLVVTAFLVCFGLYMVHSYWEFLSGRHIYRMGIPRMVGIDSTRSHPNTFAASVVVALPMVWPVWTLARKRWHYLALFGYIALSVLCVLRTGSRMGFAGLFALALMASMFSRQRYKVIIAMVLATPIAWNYIGEDLQNRFLTIVDSDAAGGHGKITAEGRTQGFLDGIKLWKAHPIFGVGPGHFGIARGGERSGLQAHNLYGQVLGELGTVGAVALLVILGGFALNFMEMRRCYLTNGSMQSEFLLRLSQAVSVTVILLLFMGWAGHNLYRYTWLWYGAFQAIALQIAYRNFADRQLDFLDSELDEL